MAIKPPWLVFGVCAYLIFALALVPASIAAKWFVSDTIRLTGVQGTVWSGEAIRGSLAGVELENIHWEFMPLDLLAGRITGKFDLVLAGGFVNTEVSATFGGLMLQKLNAITNLRILKDFAPIGATQGMVFAQVDRLVIEKNWPIEVVGDFRLMDVTVAPFAPSALGPIPIGSFRLTFSKNSNLRGQIEQLEGPLEVNGMVQLSPNRAYELQALVKALPQASQQLIEGLELMTGEPNGLGFRAFSLTGSL